MDNYIASILSEMCKRAYDDRTLLEFMYSRNPVIGSVNWTYDKSDFFAGSNSGAEAYIVTSGRNIAVAFRGSGLPGIRDMLDTAFGIPVTSLDQLVSNLTICLTNPQTDAQKQVHTYLNTTSWILDWVTNFTNALYSNVQWIPNRPDIKVGAGWLAAWLEVETDLTKSLQKHLQKLSPSASNPVNVFITGHSFGGALATVATVDIINNVTSQCDGCFVKTYTFASPLVGNGAFAGYFNNLVLGSEAESWTIRNFRDPISVANLLMANTYISSDPYVDVDMGTSVNGTGHGIENYISEFADTPPSIALTPTPVYPPFAHTVIKDLTLRAFTSSAIAYAINKKPLAWSLQLAVGAAGTKIIPLNQSNQIAAFYLPGQIDTFIVDKHVLQSLQLTVADLAECSLELIFPPTDMTEAVRSTILLDGLQFFVNGYPLYTEFNAAIALNISNASFNLNVPIPTTLIVGGSTIWTNMNGLSPKTVATWGDTSGVSVLFSYNLIYDNLLSQPQNGYQKTLLYIQPYLPGSPYEMSFQVVGGYTMIADINSQNPQLLSSWGQQFITGDTIQLFTGGYAYNRFLGCGGYSFTYFILRPNVSYSPQLGRLLGGAMYVIPENPTGPMALQWQWGFPPAVQDVSTIPACAPLVSMGDSWSNAAGRDGTQYTYLLFDIPIANSTVTNVTVSFTLDKIRCLQVSEYDPGTTDTDEIFLKLNGDTAWPVGKNYETISETQSLPIGQDYQVSLTAALVFELWDFDYFSENDLLMRFTFLPASIVQDASGNEEVTLMNCQLNHSYIMNGYGGAMYQLYLTVTSIE